MTTSSLMLTVHTSFSYTLPSLLALSALMLIMGIDPRVSTATTATMIVLTSSSVAVMFVTSGLVPWSYAVFFFGVCLLGAYVGKSKIDGYVKKTGKASLLILILATIIAIATVGCLVIMLTRLAGKDWCVLTRPRRQCFQRIH